MAWITIERNKDMNTVILGAFEMSPWICLWSLVLEKFTTSQT